MLIKLVSDPVIWLDWPGQWACTQLSLPEVHVPSRWQIKDVGEVSPWASATDEDGQGFCGTQLEELAQHKCCQGHDAILGHYPNCHSFGFPEASCDPNYLYCTSQRYHDDEEGHNNDCIQGFVHCLLAKRKWWCHTDQGGALCVTWAPKLRVSKAPWVLFILLKGLEIPSVSRWEGEGGVDSWVQITSS